MAKDFKCPEIVPPVDYLQVNSHSGFSLRRDPNQVTYQVPRSCVEALGIKTDIIPPGGESDQGAIWFTAEQAERLHAHRHTVFYEGRQ